jgi:hypothetical protein
MGDDPAVDEELSTPDPTRLLSVDRTLEAIVFQGAAEANGFGPGNIRNLGGEEQAGQHTGVTSAGRSAPIRSGPQSEFGDF